MTRYIALLRGINVGGNNKIIMRELKTVFERQGFENVVTYINSGNILFDSDLYEATVKSACEELIMTEFGLNILVWSRHRRRIGRSDTSCPQLVGWRFGFKA